MSRSQGAANGGWQGQRPPAGEPDPRTGGRPAQRPQAPQQAPQYAPARPAEPGLSRAGLQRAAGAGSDLQCPAAGLPLSAAGPSTPVRASAGSGCPADQSSGAEQPRKRAQRADARFRQLPAYPAPRLRAAGASGAAATAAPAADASGAVAPAGLTRRSGPHPRCRRLPPAGAPVRAAPAPGRPELRSMAGSRRSRRTTPMVMTSALTYRATHRFRPTATTRTSIRCSRATGPSMRLATAIRRSSSSITLAATTSSMRVRSSRPTTRTKPAHTRSRSRAGAAGRCASPVPSS